MPFLLRVFLLFSMGMLALPVLAQVPPSGGAGGFLQQEGLRLTQPQLYNPFHPIDRLTPGLGPTPMIRIERTSTKARIGKPADSTQEDGPNNEPATAPYLQESSPLPKPPPSVKLTQPPL